MIRYNKEQETDDTRYLNIKEQYKINEKKLKIKQ